MQMDLSRFKTGFFVDDFKDRNLLDIANDDCKVDIKTDDKELRVPLDFFTVKPELALSPDINVILQISHQILNF